MQVVYATCTVVPDMYNVFTAPHIQATIFNWTYLRCNWRYSDTSIRVILQIWCQIQRTSSSLRCVNCVPGHIQRIYSSSYSGHNIQLNVSALQLEIFRHFDPRYTAYLVSNTAHILRFTLCELWFRTYTMHLQLRIFRLQCSSERICATVGDISTIQWALYCNPGAKYSARSAVYAMSNVVPDIYNVITAAYIQISIFIWTYMRCNWRYLDNSMRVIQQILCQIQRTSSSLRCGNCCPGHIQSICSSS
jgi:hypothetical protein